VAAVNVDTVARQIGGRKKGKALKMVPVRMRHQQVKDPRQVLPSARLCLHVGAAEIPEPRPRVAKDIFVRAAHLDTCRIPAVACPDRKGEFVVDEGFNGLVRLQRTGAGGTDGFYNFCLDRPRGDRGGQRSSCAPEINPHFPSPASSSAFIPLQRHRHFVILSSASQRKLSLARL